MGDKKEKIVEIIGKDNVQDAPEILETYSKDQSFAPPIQPLFVVKPKNADDVQAVVQWANETDTPLVPVSSGPPRLYGDTVPSVEGAVMVDLSSMNRIIKADRLNRMAVIEPGVTYGQLQPELAKQGLRLTAPLLPRANKSVVASLLERQPTLIPRYNWSLLEPLRCLELVWGSGEKFWTGEAGAYGHSLERQWEKGLAQMTPRGPGETDWYRLVSAAQGTMGIVTWASIRCEILPKIHKLFFVTAEELDNLIDYTYWLLRLRLVDELLLVNNTNLACMLGEGPDEVRALKEELPPWILLMGIAGRDILPEERVQIRENDVRSLTQKHGLKLLSAIPGASNSKIKETLLCPSKEPYWKHGYKGGCQDILFQTQLNKTPEFLKTMYTVSKGLKYASSDIGVYIQPQHQGVCCHCEFSLPFDQEDHGEVTMVKNLYTQASEKLMTQGAYYSRPYGIWANMVYNRDKNTTNLLKGIKNILDPNNVLNTGKLCFQAE